MLEIQPTKTKELFCQKYWRMAKENQRFAIPRLGNYEFHSINNALMGISGLASTPQDIKHSLFTNDFSIRLNSKILDKDTILWRGIEKPSGMRFGLFDYASKFFLKCLKLSKGESFYMPQYSFWSSSKDLALDYAGTNKSYGKSKGIVFELNAPMGTSISGDCYPILKRASKFLCKENKLVTDEYGNDAYNHIKLDLLERKI